MKWFKKKPKHVIESYWKPTAYSWGDPWGEVRLYRVKYNGIVVSCVKTEKEAEVVVEDIRKKLEENFYIKVEIF